MQKKKHNAIKDMDKMTHIAVLLDSTAPSFCYYDNTLQNKKAVLMPIETLKGVIKFAKKQNLFLNVIYGHNEVSAEINQLIKTVPHVKIIPFSLLDKVSEGIPVIDYNKNGNASVHDLPASGIQNIIIRVGKRNMKKLSNDISVLSSKTQRINLILTHIPNFADKDIPSYQKHLLTIIQVLKDRCLSGSPFEFNIITDRLALHQMRNCNAGITHLTVAPDGNWYVCPGFYYTGAPSLGTLDEGIHVKNQRLYELEYAPICSACDCYHCKRCVFMNHQMTLEVNTPSHEQCIVSHSEREISGMFLSELQKAGLLTHIQPIPILDYRDPFDLVSGKKNQALPAGHHDTVSCDDPNPFKESCHEGKEDCGNCNHPGKFVGYVTPAERDEIKHLFERRNSLEDLLQSVARMSSAELDESAFYERLVSDLTKAKSNFNQWWEEKAHLYHWKKGTSGRFIIDFNSCKVFAIINEDKENAH